jgi:hypothetical protein
MVTREVEGLHGFVPAERFGWPLSKARTNYVQATASLVLKVQLSFCLVLRCACYQDDRRFLFLIGYMLH